MQTVSIWCKQVQYGANRFKHIMMAANRINHIMMVGPQVKLHRLLGGIIILVRCPGAVAGHGNVWDVFHSSSVNGRRFIWAWPLLKFRRMVYPSGVVSDWVPPSASGRSSTLMLLSSSWSAECTELPWSSFAYWLNMRMTFPCCVRTAAS